MKTAVFLACIEQDNDGPTGWNFGRCALCPSQPLYQTLRDSPSTGRCPIPVTAPLDLSGVAERRWPPSFSPTDWECPLALRCAASHPALGPSGCGPPCRGENACGEPSRPRHIRALGTCGSGLRRRRCAGCVAVLITARALCTLVLPSPSLFRRGWPPPGLSPPCVRPSAPAGGGFCACLGRLRPFSPPEPHQDPRHLRAPGG